MQERHALQVMSPTLGPDESGTYFMSIADGDDEDLMGIEDSQPGQAPLETRVQFTQQTKGKHKYGGIPTIPQGIAFNTQHLMHHMRDHWRSQGYNALHYQQEQFESAAQEHERVAHEEVKLQLFLLQLVQQRK